MLASARCNFAGEPNKRASKDAVAGRQARILEQEAKGMKRDLRALAAAGSLVLAFSIGAAAIAQNRVALERGRSLCGAHALQAPLQL